MFTETLTRRARRSPLLELLTGPHGVDRYTELVDRTCTTGEARAKVVAVRRQTPRSVTLVLEPNQAFTGFLAGQHINLTVEINGRRRTRCYSPASAEDATHIELTIGRHDGGLVSTYLCDNARPGMVLGLDSVGGDFTLPADRPTRILFVSGGSGITPVMSMVRTMRDEGSDRGSPSSTTRVAPKKPATPTNLQRCLECVCCTATPAKAQATSPATSMPTIWPPRCPNPKPSTSAVRPHWWTPSARTAPTRGSRASYRPRSLLLSKPPAAGSRSPTAVSRPPTTANRCWCRPRTQDSHQKADAGWASATAAPVARPAGQYAT